MFENIKLKNKYPQYNVSNSFIEDIMFKIKDNLIDVTNKFNLSTLKDFKCVKSFKYTHKDEFSNIVYNNVINVIKNDQYYYPYTIVEKTNGNDSCLFYEVYKNIIKINEINEYDVNSIDFISN